MKLQDIVFTDIPDEDAKTDTEYWDMHTRIALQSLNMALMSLAKVIENCDTSSLVYVSNQVALMVEKYSKVSKYRTDQLNNKRFQ